MRLKLLFLLLNILSTYLLSQNNHTIHYTINEGLPANSIRCIFRDSRGFLWLGTDAGVSRFDGNSFVNFSSKDGLANDHVWSITETKKGELVFGCYGGGISFYNGKKFTKLTKKDSLNLISVRNLRYSNLTQNIYAGMQNGLLILNGSKRKEISSKLGNCKYELLVGAVHELNKDTVFISTLTSGCYFLLLKNYSVIPVPKDNPLNDFVGYDLLNEGNKQVVVNNGIKFHSQGKVKEFSFPDSIHGPAWSVTKENDSSYWIATWGGGDGNSYGDLVHFDGKSFEKTKKRFGLNIVSFWSVYFDKQSNRLFVGTLGDGLHVIPMAPFNYSDLTIRPEPTSLAFYVDKAGREWTVSPKEIHVNARILSVKDYIPFICDKLYTIENAKFKVMNDPAMTYDKVEKLKKEGKYFSRNVFLMHDDKIVTYNSIPNLNKYLTAVKNPANNWASRRKVFENFVSFGGIVEHAGAIYIGTTMGLLKLNEQTLAPLDFFDVGSQNIYLKDSKNRVWSRMEYSELNRIDDLNDPTSYHVYKNTKHRAYPADVLCATECANGDIWFGTWNQGLFLYRNDKFINYTRENSILLSNDVSALINTSKQQLVIGYPNGDVGIFESKDTLRQIALITKDNGLKGNSIYAIEEDASGKIIIITNKGLFRFDYKNWNPGSEISLQHFDSNDGFVITRTCTAYRDSKENLLLLSNNKYIRIDPSKLDDLQYKKDQIYFEKVLINYKAVNWDSLSSVPDWINVPEEINLAYDKNVLEIYYNNINVAAATKDLFSYRLEGLSQNWSPYTQERKAIFTNLAPGDYTLTVRCKNNLRTGGVIEKSLHIIISPPWWRTKIFYACSLLLVLLIIVGSIRFRERSLRKRQAELEKTVGERTLEVVQQKHLIEEKQKEIIDSIRYARRIQESLLPKEKYIARKLKELGETDLKEVVEESSFESPDKKE